MTEENPEQQFDLVMPFVVVESRGGPYDDEAFTAGWRLGVLDQDLSEHSMMGTTTISATTRHADRPQVDLIAMRHGYSITVVGSDEEWDSVEFRRDDS